MNRINLKASTLIETIVAMVIITGVFSTAIVIYLNVSTSSINTHEAQQESIGRSIAQAFIAENNWQNQRITRDEGEYFVQFKPHAEYENVLHLEVSNAAAEIIHQQLCYAD